MRRARLLLPAIIIVVAMILSIFYAGYLYYQSLMPRLPYLSVPLDGLQIAVKETDTAQEVQIPIAIDRPIANEITVDYCVTTYDASGGEQADADDFEPITGMLHLEPFTARSHISVRVGGDRLVESDERFCVQITGSNYAELLPKQVVDDVITAVVIIENDDVPPPPIHVSVVSVVEGDDPQSRPTVTVRFTLEHPSEKAMTYRYETEDGTAIEGTDYVRTQGEVTFAPGETEREITLEILSDLVPESTEHFRLRVGSPEDEPAPVDPVVVDIPIEDDDPPLPKIVTQTEIAIDETDEKVTIDLTAALEFPYAKDLEVVIESVDGTATAGTDFEPVKISVPMQAGQTEIRVPLVVLADDNYEGDETFTVRIGLNHPADTEDAIITVTIGDDELPPTISLTPADQTIDETEATQTVDLILTLSEPCGCKVKAKVGVESETATSGEDYTLGMQTIAIPAGETEFRLPLTIIGDSQPEDDETLLVRVTEIDGAVPASLEARVTIADNDERPATIEPISTVFGKERTTGQQMYEIPVRLAEASAHEVTVEATVVSGTATAGRDYFIDRRPIVFKPGETEQRLRISVVGDAQVEPDEEFTVRLRVVDSPIGAERIFNFAIPDDDRRLGGRTLLVVLANQALVDANWDEETEQFTGPLIEAIKRTGGDDSLELVDDTVWIMDQSRHLLPLDYNRRPNQPYDDEKFSAMFNEAMETIGEDMKHRLKENDTSINFVWYTEATHPDFSPDELIVIPDVLKDRIARVLWAGPPSLRKSSRLESWFDGNVLYLGNVSDANDIISSSYFKKQE